MSWRLIRSVLDVWPYPKDLTFIWSLHLTLWLLPIRCRWSFSVQQQGWLVPEDPWSSIDSPWKLQPVLLIVPRCEPLSWWCSHADAPFSVWIASEVASKFSTVTPLCKLGVKVRRAVTHHSVQAFPLSRISLFKLSLVEEELCYPLTSPFLGRKVWCMLTACLIFVFQGLFLLGVKFFRCMGNIHLKYSCFSKSLKCTSKG